MALNDADRQRLASLLFPKRTAYIGGGGSSGAGLRLVKAASDSAGGMVSVIIGAPEYDEFGNEIVSLADVTVSIPIICAASAGDDVLIAIIDGSPVAIGVPGKGMDFPVHRGTSGIWDYVIYASGKAECWGRSSNVTAGSWSSWGGIYYSGPHGGAAYPTGLFSSIDYARAEWIPVGSDAWSGEYRDGSVSNAPRVYAYRGSSSSGTTGFIQYHAVGTVGSITY